MKNYFLFFGLIGLTLVACDKIAQDDIRIPIIVPDKVDPEEITDTTQNILLEDFTGQKCPNCPEAAKEAERLLHEHDGRMVAIAVHTGLFATTGGVFVHDFVTPEGDDLRKTFEIQGYPTGIFNRFSIEGGSILYQTIGDWAGVVEVMLKKTPQILMTLKGSEMKGTEITAKVSFAFKEEFSNQALNIVLAITEDSIIGYQKSGSEYLPEYSHNHVLRQMPLGAFGSPYLLPEESKEKGAKEGRKFKFNLREGVVSNQSSLIAYVIDPNTKYVFQVCKIRLAEISK